jgi:TfoX/Sxy family transcriptional regulator of competence genes
MSTKGKQDDGFRTLIRCLFGIDGLFKNKMLFVEEKELKCRLKMQ